MSKRKKHTLSFDQEFDFDMIGICSHHRDYRLAWGLNEKLGIQLTKSDDSYLLQSKKGTGFSAHSMYKYHDWENRTDFILIKNSENGTFLIPEKPSMDYFLFLYNNVGVNVDQVVSNLKNVQSVLGVYLLDPEEIQSAENLVFE